MVHVLGSFPFRVTGICTEINEESFKVTENKGNGNDNTSAVGIFYDQMKESGCPLKRS
jgi:accessory colonization factor AcfC